MRTATVQNPKELLNFYNSIEDELTIDIFTKDKIRKTFQIAYDVWNIQKENDKMWEQFKNMKNDKYLYQPEKRNKYFYIFCDSTTLNQIIALSKYNKNTTILHTVLNDEIIEEYIETEMKKIYKSIDKIIFNLQNYHSCSFDMDVFDYTF